MKFIEKPLVRKEIFTGKVFDVYKEIVLLPDGSTAQREVVSHAGGVCVIPVDGDFVYMVRQYRRGADCVCLEFPAGKLNPGEDHYDAGLRELREEIGATAKKYTYIGAVYPTPAYCSERIHLYIADKLEIGEQQLDDGEFLTVERIKTVDLLQMVKKGQISDAKTIIGAYKLAEYIENNN